MPLWLIEYNKLPFPGDSAFLYAKVPRTPEGEVLGFGLLTLSTLPGSAPLPASFSSTNGVFSFRVFSLLLYHHACFLSLSFM